MLATALACVSCGNAAPSPPTVSPPSGSETIRGTERLGWDQAAADTFELASIHYVIYVDGVRVELADASCGTTATAAGFSCSAQLPTLTAGSHTLELAAYLQDSSVLESPRSAPLRVTVTGIVIGLGAADASGDSGAGAAARGGGRGTDSTPWPAAATRLADGLDRPTDLAFTPDGRLWIAERSGRVRVLQEGVLLAPPALIVAESGDEEAPVLALAVDPQFTRTHYVFAIYAARSRSGALAFVLARYREAGNTLGDRILLLDGVPAAAEPHASLRFGPDEKLYAAFDDGGSAAAAEDGASVNGKILRLNPDGTTPRDQPRGSPVLAGGLHSPRGLVWPRHAARPWSADERRVGQVEWKSTLESMVGRDDEIYIASEAGLMRATIDPHSPNRFSASSDMVSDVRVRAVASAPDGAIVFATDSALGVVTRER